MNIEGKAVLPSIEVTPHAIGRALLEDFMERVKPTPDQVSIVATSSGEKLVWDEYGWGERHPIEEAYCYVINDLLKRE